MKSIQGDRDLEKTKLDNNFSRWKKLNTIYAHHPELSAIDDQIRAERLRLLQNTLSLTPNNNETASDRLDMLVERRNNYLASHKLPANYGKQEFMCSRCNDTGVYKGDICECAKKQIFYRKISKIHEMSGLAPDQLKETFSGFDMAYYSKTIYASDGITSQYDQAQYLLQEANEFVVSIKSGKKPKGMYICGEPGRGKTFIANCIANALIDASVPTFYRKYDQLIMQIQKTYGNHDESALTAAEILKMLFEVDVLILDDLGVERASEDTGNKLHQIIDQRLNSGLPTVITSNYHIGELCFRYDDHMLGKRIVSRIADLCSIYEIFSIGDIRMLKNKDNTQG